MTTKLSIFTICLVSMALAGLAQPPVLDIDGKPVESGVQYYVESGIFDVAGGLTLIRHDNIQCPFYVGQEPFTPPNVSRGFPVIFKPFNGSENIVREDRDLMVTFQVFTTCLQSTAWRVGEENPATGRRFIVTGGRADYFSIRKNASDYNFVWCPGESCPNCGRPRCGSAGIYVENDQKFLVLDVPTPYPFRFSRV